MRTERDKSRGRPDVRPDWLRLIRAAQTVICDLSVRINLVSWSTSIRLSNFITEYGGEDTERNGAKAPEIMLAVWRLKSTDIKTTFSCDAELSVVAGFILPINSNRLKENNLSGRQGMDHASPSPDSVVHVPLLNQNPGDATVYDPDQPDDRLDLTASAFNQLGQYISSPCRRTNCYAELAVFFLGGGSEHRRYSLRLSAEGRPG